MSCLNNCECSFDVKIKDFYSWSMGISWFKLVCLGEINRRIASATVKLLNQV